MNNNRYFAAPQAGDHVWVFAKGPMGYARWLVPVKLWEIDGCGRARPVTAVELKDPYKMSDAPGYPYAVPVGDYYLYDEKIYDGIGDAFNQWCKEQVQNVT